MSRIYFSNIFATSENGCFVGGDVAGKVNNVYFNNVRIRPVRVTHYPNPQIDLRPCKGQSFVKGRPDVWSQRATDCVLDVEMMK